MRGFNKFIEESGLFDPPLLDGNFTWANSRETLGLVDFFCQKLGLIGLVILDKLEGLELN